MADFREPAHAALAAAAAAGLGAAALVRRTTYVPDIDRQIDAADWPITGRALVVMVEGPGTCVRTEKQSENRTIVSAVDIYSWIYDRISDASRCTTLNAHIYTLGEALKTANTVDSFTRVGYRFEFTGFELLQGRQGAPPYAGVRMRAEALIRER